MSDDDSIDRFVSTCESFVRSKSFDPDEYGSESISFKSVFDLDWTIGLNLTDWLFLTGWLLLTGWLFLIEWLFCLWTEFVVSFWGMGGRKLKLRINNVTWVFGFGVKLFFRQYDRNSFSISSRTDWLTFLKSFCLRKFSTMICDSCLFVCSLLPLTSWMRL